MRVLLAPDLVQTPALTLSAREVGEALRRGWARARSDDDVRIHPLSTGTLGMLDVVHAALGGRDEVVVTADVFGEVCPATWLRVGLTAYVDAGVVLADGGGRAAAATQGSSAGLGQMLAAVVQEGVGRVVLGLPVTSTHDAGLGMLFALADAQPSGAKADIAAAVTAARQRLAGVDVVVAAATDLPLTGLGGAGAALHRHADLDASVAQEKERSLSAAIAAVESCEITPTSLLDSGARPRASRRPHSGAGGGVAFALSILGARVLSGADVLAVETGLAAALDDAEMVLTATTSLDGDALATGVLGVLGRQAAVRLVPVVATGMQVLLNRRELSGTGIEGIYPVVGPHPLAPQQFADADVAQALSQRASRVARTWSR